MGIYLPPLTRMTSNEGGFDILDLNPTSSPFTFFYEDGVLFINPYNPLFYAQIIASFFPETKIEWQKDLINNFFSPIFDFVHATYGFPLDKQKFTVMSSPDVQKQFQRHPELQALTPIFDETVDCLVTGPFGFEKSGPGIHQRMINQFIANCARLDWTVQMTMDVWEATVIAGKCNTTELPSVIPTDPVQRAFSYSLIVPQLVRKMQADAPLTDQEKALMREPYINAITQAALYQMQHPSTVVVVPQVQDRLPNQKFIPQAAQFEGQKVDQAKEIISRYLTGQRISATDLSWFQDPRNWDVIWSITHGGIDLGPLPDGVSCPFPAQPYPPPKPQPPSPPPQPQPQPPCPVACQCADLVLQHQLDHYGEVQNTLVIPQLQHQGQLIEQGQQHDQQQDRQVLEIASQIPPIQFEADQTRQDLRDLYDGLPDIITRKVNDFYDAVIRTPLLSALDCCFNKALKKVENAKQDLCQFGRDAWGMMAECWLNANTEVYPQTGGEYGQLSRVEDLQRRFFQGAAEQSTGAYAHSVVRYWEVFYAVADGNYRLGLSGGQQDNSYPGYVFSDPTGL